MSNFIANGKGHQDKKKLKDRKGIKKNTGNSWRTKIKKKTEKWRKKKITL